MLSGFQSGERSTPLNTASTPCSRLRVRVCRRPSRLGEAGSVIAEKNRPGGIPCAHTPAVSHLGSSAPRQSRNHLVHDYLGPTNVISETRRCKVLPIAAPDHTEIPRRTYTFLQTLRRGTQSSARFTSIGSKRHTTRPNNRRSQLLKLGLTIANTLAVRLLLYSARCRYQADAETLVLLRRPRPPCLCDKM